MDVGSRHETRGRQSVVSLASDASQQEDDVALRRFEPLRDSRGRRIVPPSAKKGVRCFFSWEETGEVQDSLQEDERSTQTTKHVLIVEVPLQLEQEPAQPQRVLRLVRQLPNCGFFSDWGPMVAICDVLIQDHRQALRSAIRVLELGCGIGLPSLLCALLGGRVLATDLPGALEDVRANSEVNDWSQRIWRVVGGFGPDGVPVTRERGGMTAPERLSIGALVQELDLFEDSNLIHYRRLTGTGPEEGWTYFRRKQSNKDILVRTEERPPPKITTRLERGWGSILATPLEWDAEEAVELMRRADELEALSRNRDVRSKKGAGRGIVEDGSHNRSSALTPKKEHTAGFPAPRSDDPNLADLVLCSDCVCEAVMGSTWESLVQTVEASLAPTGTAIISVRRRANDGIERFVQRLSRRLRFERGHARKSDADAVNGVEIFSCQWPARGENFETAVDRAPMNPRMLS